MFRFMSVIGILFWMNAAFAENANFTCEKEKDGHKWTLVVQGDQVTLKLSQPHPSKESINTYQIRAGIYDGHMTSYCQLDLASISYENHYNKYGRVLFHGYVKEDENKLRVRRFYWHECKNQKTLPGEEP